MLQKIRSTHPDVVTSNPTKPLTHRRVRGTDRPEQEQQANELGKCGSYTKQACTHVWAGKKNPKSYWGKKKIKEGKKIHAVSFSLF